MRSPWPRIRAARLATPQAPGPTPRASRLPPCPARRVPQALSLAAVCALALALAACSSRARPGAPAPAFALTTAAGHPVTLRSFRGKVLVLNFWAAWCQPCIEETPSLNALAAKLQGRPIQILGVAVYTNPTRYRQFLSTFHVRYPTARDFSADLAHRYGTRKIPETYIVNSRGVVVRKIVGAVNWDSPGMVQYLKDLAAGRIPGSPAAS